MTKIDTKKIANDFTKLNKLEKDTAITFADNLPFYLEIKNNMDFIVETLKEFWEANPSTNIKNHKFYKYIMSPKLKWNNNKKRKN